MSKGKLVVFSLMAVALLSWQILPTSVDTANSGFVHPCSSTASTAAGTYCVLACPAGDGTDLITVGAQIELTVKDATGAAMVGVPSGDVWLIGCAAGLTLCGGSGSSNADAATDGAGYTTISGGLAVGGCDQGVKVVVQNTVLADPLNCNQDLCLAMDVHSADIDGNLTVNVGDFGLFGLDYPSPPKVYNECIDFNCQADLGVDIGVVDFGLYGLHHFHDC